MVGVLHGKHVMLTAHTTAGNMWLDRFGAEGTGRVLTRTMGVLADSIRETLAGTPNEDRVAIVWANGAQYEARAKVRTGDE